MNCFVHDYPLSLKEALLTPCLEALILDYFGQTVPWPSQAGLETFLGYFDYSLTAFRTALSRAKKQGEIWVAKDAQGIKRVQPGPLMQQYVRYFLAEPFAGSTFSLILFHFSSQQAKERYRLKEMLANLNYVMLTQNAYLRYGNQPQEVDQLLAQQGFTEHVFHFAAIQTLPPRLESLIPELYQTELWAERLRDYQGRFQDYLYAEPLDSEQGYLRYLYTRAAFHKNIMARAPFLPERYFSETCIVQDVFAELVGVTQRFLPVHAELFKRIFA